MGALIFQIQLTTSLCNTTTFLQ